MSDTFESAMISAGLEPPYCDSDGKIHRFSSNGKRHDKAGWYVFWGDAGVFGDWRSGFQETWFPPEDEDATREEKAARRAAAQQKLAKAKQKAAKERTRKQGAARREATRVWSKSVNPTQHPYLDRKQVQAHGIRQYGQFLIVPLVDETGGLWSLQSISPEGNKRFMPGGRMQGRFHLINGSRDRIGIAEGYATAATVHEKTGDTLLVAFNAGNLEPVAVTARAMYPAAAHLTIWGDNDQFSDGNPGVTKAHQAATVSRANAVKIPYFSGYDLTTKPTDWNDLYLLERGNG
jgi:putative DNA primase/helicase